MSGTAGQSATSNGAGGPGGAGFVAPAATTQTTQTNGQANGHANGHANGATLMAPTQADREQAAAREWLPPEYRQDPTFQTIKDLGGLAKSYKHAQSLIGADRSNLLRLPDKPDAPEWAQVYDRLGRPEKPEAYQFEAPAGIDDTTLADYRKTAHQLGLSADQAAKLMSFYGQNLTAMQTRQAEAAQAAQADVTAALKREWGQTYDDNLHLARRAARELGGDGIISLLEATRLGDHPDVVRMFAQIGKRLSEPNALRGGGGGEFDALTPAAAQREIAMLNGDREFFKQLSDRANPRYHAARERWDALHKAAYPDK
jgi:hypothetical protein